MQTQELAPHLETLKKALGNKIGTEITEEDLQDEFAKYLEYGVPVDQAIRTILRHHGVQAQSTGTAQGPSSQERVTIEAMPKSSPYVHLQARFLSLNTKQVKARGEDKEIYWGLLGDESGTVAYTSWRPLEGLAKGDEVQIKGAYSKEWNGQAQVNFGDRTEIQKLEPGTVPKTPSSWKDVTVAEVQDGMRGLALEGRVLGVAPRQINLKSGEQKTIWGGKLVDETGSIEFTSWHDHGLEEGSAVRIAGCYVRAYRGVPQLNFDADARIEPAAKELPPAAELEVSNPVGVGELIERGGGNDVSVTATLLEVRPGSGLIFRDKETNRVVHGPQTAEGVPDLRIKGILDDGTGAVNVIIGRPLTEALLGKTLEQCQEEARQAFRHEIIQEQLQEQLASKLVKVTGNALSDEYGIMLIAQTVNIVEPKDVKTRAGELLAKLEGA